MEYFANTYATARQNFRALTARTNARVTPYRMPGLVGAEGEDLCVDVAILGAKDAARAALVIIGTHGAEGYAGSAILCRWLDSRSGTLPADLKLVLVHAVNPWSFSHKTRTTENNVDLNRNFLANWAGRNNAAFRELAPFLQPTHLDAAAILRSFHAYNHHLNSHGWHLENEMLCGQTDDPRGLFYAGTGPEWANQNFRQILREQLFGASHIGFIDFHTGVGEFGELVHLIFAEPGTEERAQSLRWFGLDDQEGSPYKAGSVPRFEGLLCKAIAQELPGAKVSGAVIEFGTADAYGMFRTDALDRWLRFEGRDDPDAALLRDQYRDSCTPPDVAWRRLVLAEGPKCVDQLLNGIAGWGR